MERAHAFEDDACAGLQPLARMQKGLPSIFRDAADQQAFHGTAAWDATADEPSREDASVVNHEDIARREQLWKRGHRLIGERARGSIEEEKTRATSLRGWFLRNEIVRKIVVEIADVQVPAILRQCMPAAPDGLGLINSSSRYGPQGLSIFAVPEQRPAELTPMNAQKIEHKIHMSREPSTKIPVAQNSVASAKPHSTVPNAARSSAPGESRSPGPTRATFTAKHPYCLPAATWSPR